MADEKRVLSGMRPTGRLHLGHLIGVLDNWVRLQDEHPCYFFVADWHALTSDFADTSGITDHTFQMVVDWLAAGLDPQKATFFIQSHILEHAELHLLLSMITPLGWLERVPTYKEQRANIRDKDLGNYGFLGYPVLQSADILLYRAGYVPVGEDQSAHVELTREIARRFNSFYYLPSPGPELFATTNRPALNSLLKIFTEGKTSVPETEELSSGRIAELTDLIAHRAGDREFYRKVLPELGKQGLSDILGIFPEPQVLLTPTPRVAGTDGRRMAKSYGNTIDLADEPAIIEEKVRGMITDPQRARRSDPGRPEVCPVFSYHQKFSPEEMVNETDQDCRTAKIGCVDCKKNMAANLITALGPIQERRHRFEASPGEVIQILTDGTQRAREAAEETMAQVRRAMNMIPRIRQEEQFEARRPVDLDLDL